MNITTLDSSGNVVITPVADLVSTGQTDASIALSWANFNEIVDDGKIVIERSVNGSAFTLVSELPMDATTFNDSN